MWKFFIFFRDNSSKKFCFKNIKFDKFFRSHKSSRWSLRVLHWVNYCLLEKMPNNNKKNKVSQEKVCNKLEETFFTCCMLDQTREIIFYWPSQFFFNIYTLNSRARLEGAFFKFNYFFLMLLLPRSKFNDCKYSSRVQFSLLFIIKQWEAVEIWKIFFSLILIEDWKFYL